MDGVRPGQVRMGRRRWNRDAYPEEWEALSEAFRASRNYTCEHCGTVRGTWRISKGWRLYRSKVVAAHKYPNDTWNPNPELLCLCERCHFLYDAQFREGIEEGRHQAVLHGVLVEQQYMVEQAEERGPVCCSCGVPDWSLAFGCGRCGRLVHLEEPACGYWLQDSEFGEVFWCLECVANGLP